MIAPVRSGIGLGWIPLALFQSSPRGFRTGIGAVPKSVGPGLDWTGLVWISRAQCAGLEYISHCIGLLMGEIYLNGTEYTDRTVITTPRVGIQRWVVIKCEDESCFQWYWTMTQCRNCKCLWTGPDQARPVQPSIWTGLYWALPQTGSVRTGGIIAPMYTSEYVFKYPPVHALKIPRNCTWWPTPSLLDCTLPSRSPDTLKNTPKYAHIYTSGHVLKWTPRHALMDARRCTRWHPHIVLDYTHPRNTQDKHKYTPSTLPNISSTFSSTLPGMLSRTLPIALDGAVTVWLTVRSEVCSPYGLTNTPNNVLKYTPNCTRWQTPSLLGSTVPSKLTAKAESSSSTFRLTSHSIQSEFMRKSGSSSWNIGREGEHMIGYPDMRNNTNCIDLWSIPV